MKLQFAGWLLFAAIQFGQAAASTPELTNWIDAGSQVVITALLLVTWKGLFWDQRWVPARDAAHDTNVDRKLDRILIKLDEDPDDATLR